jgi:hypothetical protein
MTKIINYIFIALLGLMLSCAGNGGQATTVKLIETNIP